MLYDIFLYVCMVHDINDINIYTFICMIYIYAKSYVFSRNMWFPIYYLFVDSFMILSYFTPTTLYEI